MKKKIAAMMIPVIALGGSWFADDHPATAAAYSEGVIVNSVNFRDKPSLSGDQIRYLKSGEHVDILDDVNSYWYKIKDRNGTIGYVSSSVKYVQVDSAANLAYGEGVIIRSVNFRDKPSLSGERIRYLKSGEHVKVKDLVNSYWYEVEDQYGTTGFVSSQSKYIKVNASASMPSVSASLNMDRVIDAGMNYLGTPYEFGSNRSTVATFDCSDFVRQAFKDGAGISLPADSRKQADYVKNIGKTTTNWRDLKPGDLMFFMSYKGTKQSDYSGINKASQRISHDGIYLGNGKILHTYSKKSGGVRIDSIDGKHWEYRFVFGGSAVK